MAQPSDQLERQDGAHAVAEKCERLAQGGAASPDQARRLVASIESDRAARLIGIPGPGRRAATIAVCGSASRQPRYRQRAATGVGEAEERELSGLHVIKPGEPFRLFRRALFQA